MIFYYLDASAWVKRYYEEAGTTWMQSLFAQGHTIASSSLGFVEVMATLARKHKAQEITDLLLQEKTRELEIDWDNFIQIQLTSEAAGNAAALAKKLALRGADAVHLSSALLLRQQLQQESDQLIVVASDNELKKAAQASSLTIIDPEEHDVPTQSQPQA